MYKSKINILLLAFLGILTFLLGGILVTVDAITENNDVVINEICSNNFSVKHNENGKYCDYIEIYNPTMQDIQLDEYYLSDDKEMLQKYSLEGMTVASKSHLIVWLDQDKNTLAPETVDVAGKQNNIFGISQDGEGIYLVKGREEKIVDYVYVPPLVYDTCWARIEDGKKQWDVMETTAGTSNATAKVLLAQTLKKPQFSKESGFCEAEFFLKIKAGPGEEIYYTLDGSKPTPDSIKYSGKIEIRECSGQENLYASRKDLSPTRDYVPEFLIDKANVVRAISYNPDTKQVSDVVTKVYFVGYEDKEEYCKFPIISLVADSEDLFGYEKGIYGNGKKLEEYKDNGGFRDGVLLDSYVDEEGKVHNLYEASNAFQEGKEWEREANLIYFNEDHEFEFSQEVGIRIAGASTRGTPQKSFSIYGRDIYDEKVVFPYEFFDGYPLSSIKLRNGGNHNDRVKIIDAFVESLVEDRDVSIQRSTPCIVFLNGEYWGIYNIRERYNEEYISTHYGVSQDNIWMIDAGEAKIGNSAAKEAYDYFVTMATECDLSYDDVYAMVSELIDVQSFIDYCCINLYMDNRDLSFGQNMALWRSIENDGSEYGDTKWRWMIFDMDEAIQKYDENTDAAEWMENYCLMQEPVLQSFMKNKQFREQFYKTLVEIGETNFNYNVVSELLKEWKAVYEEQLLINHQRFFNEGYNKQELEEDFKKMDDFFAGRLPFIKKSIEEVQMSDVSIE